MTKTRLELTWIGKDNGPRLEPRILLEDPEKSYHAARRVSEKDIFDNRLIFGDNLLALKALEHEFAGKVDCIYIDPPFNTGQAFAQYEDGLEHSIWLTMMRDRLSILRRLLSDSGTIWVHCDDNEQAYLKIIMDELFGRDCFVTAIIWQKVDSPNDNKVPVTPDHDYILTYMKTFDGARLHQKVSPDLLSAYRTTDESGRLYRDRLLKKNGKSSLREDRPSMYFPVIAPDGTKVYPIHDDGREARWSLGKDNVDRLVAEKKLIWKQRRRNGQQVWVPYTREFAPDTPTRPYPSIWTDVHTSRQAKAHLSRLFPGETPFATPKPEPLIKRILEMATVPGDIILDSFAGSGTTGAVAHKMGRRWIMVELGEHCHTHIIPRMKKVIDGEDLGGISVTQRSKTRVKLCKNCRQTLCDECAEKVGVDSKGGEQVWLGGGGFRYYRLAPSLLEKDKFGNWVINQQYNATMLAEAVCKLEGFTYAPSDTVYWQHGHSTESDFIYVTTQSLTREQLAQVSDEVGENQSLQICCGAFRCKKDAFPNLTIKKIPKAVLKKCEYGHDDYSLEISELPPPPPAPENGAVPQTRAERRKRRQTESEHQMTLDEGSS